MLCLLVFLLKNAVKIKNVERLALIFHVLEMSTF